MTILPRPRLVLLALLLLLATEVVVVTVLGGTPEVRSKAQLFIFPFLLLLLSQLSCFGTRIPRALLLVAGALAITGAAISRNGHRIYDGTFLMARFKGDRLGGETRIVRDRVRRVPGLDGRARVNAYEGEITRLDQAEAALSKDRNLAGVVWGGKRAVVLTLRRSPAQTLRTLGEGSTAGQYLSRHKKLRELSIITSIPAVGVSFADKSETVEFIGRIAATWGSFSRDIFGSDAGLFLERQLLVMAAMHGAWTSPEPRVFAQWMLGTYYLGQGLVATQYERGVFECTQETLQSAYRKLRRGERRPLEAAIVNNLAVAQLIIEDGTIPYAQSVAAAITQLRKASILVRGPQGDRDIRKVVDSNIRILKSSLNGKRKKRKKTV